MGQPSFGRLPTTEDTKMKRTYKGLIIAVLLAIPATAWAGTKLATGGCCPFCDEAGADK
jgi:hypothetical protein